VLNAAVGFRAHSGWAVAVAVAGGAAVYRGRIELCDCLLPGSTQPYHAAAKMPLAEAEIFLNRCAQISAAMAERAVCNIAADLGAQRYRLTTCSILLGAGRPLGGLARTLASHPLIHAAEGEFYREALRQGCRRCGIPTRGVPEREIRSGLRHATELGKALGKPWRQDEKLCALAAMR